MKTMIPTQKSSKTLSKLTKNTRDRNQNQHKQLHSPENKSRLDMLQNALEKQIQMRQSAQQKIFELINHLQHTKKSKVPPKYEKITNKKFNSPNKTNPRITIKENQTCTSCQNNSQSQFSQIMSKFQSNMTIVSRKFEIVSQELQRIDRNMNGLKQNIQKLQENREQDIKLIDRNTISTCEKYQNNLLQITSSKMQKDIAQTQKILHQLLQKKISQIQYINKSSNNNDQIIIQQFNRFKKQIQKQFQGFIQHENQLLQQQQNNLDSLRNSYQANIVKIQGEQSLILEDIQKIRQKYEKLSITFEQNVTKISEFELLTVKNNQNLQQKINNLRKQSQVEIINNLNFIRDSLEALQNNYQNKFIIIQQNVTAKLDYLDKLGYTIDKNFDQLTQQIKNTSSNVIQTKQSLQTIIYGQSKSKQKILSTVSIQIPSNHQPQRYTHAYWKQTIDALVRRTQSLENSFNIIFQEYLKKPLI